MKPSSARPTVFYSPKRFSAPMSLTRFDANGRRNQALSAIKKGIMDKPQDPKEQIKPTATREQGDQQRGGRKQSGGQQDGGQQGGSREQRGGQQGGRQQGGGREQRSGQQTGNR
jgi:hypothetical protein